MSFLPGPLPYLLSIQLEVNVFSALFLQDLMPQSAPEFYPHHSWGARCFSLNISAGISPKLFTAEFVLGKAGSCGCQEKVKNFFPLGKP